MGGPSPQEALHAPDDDVTAQLLIGPVLRRITSDRATIWVETSEPASVRVEAEGGGSGSARTFGAYGHHYAIVVVEGLRLDTASPYRVLLDDRPAWPPADSPYPPSVIRTRAADDRDQPVRLVFGSCREATPQAARKRLPPDALDAYARRLLAGPDNPDLRADTILLLGDQVYADKTSARVRRFLRRRRAAGHHHHGPSDQVISFEEYTKLYLESWSDPELRWLFATVPTLMIFDDHEIIDDWNTSASWRADMSRQPWWHDRIAGGLASYWVYQHLGNLSPDELAADPLYPKVSVAEDATGLLREFGRRVDDPDSADNAVKPYQWSFALDIGRTRIVTLERARKERGRRAAVHRVGRPRAACQLGRRHVVTVDMEDRVGQLGHGLETILTGATARPGRRHGEPRWMPGRWCATSASSSRTCWTRSRPSNGTRRRCARAGAYATSPRI